MRPTGMGWPPGGTRVTRAAWAGCPLPKLLCSNSTWLLRKASRLVWMAWAWAELAAEMTAAPKQPVKRRLSMGFGAGGEGRDGGFRRLPSDYRCFYRPEPCEPWSSPSLRGHRWRRCDLRVPRPAPVRGQTCLSQKPGQQLWGLPVQPLLGLLGLGLRWDSGRTDPTPTVSIH